MSKRRAKKAASVHARLHEPYDAFLSETAEAGGLTKTAVIEGLLSIASELGAPAVAQAIIYRQQNPS
jgi:hypothetical protein